MNIIRTVYVRVFSALAAVGLLSSCQEDVCMTQQSEHTVGFYAGGSQTRTAMLPDGLSSIWIEGDQLSLWALNSSGSYTLSNQIFKAYGLDAGRGFFTSTFSEQMPEDSYSYIACYPAPVAVSGSKVTFNLPSVQDGKASSGADIMISDPVRHGPLTAIPEPEDHSCLRMSMNHMMHHFRFFVPEDDQFLGDDRIERLVVSFPAPVAGEITYDLADIDAPFELQQGQTDVELKLAQPIGVSSGDDYQFACLAFAPVQFQKGQSLQITRAYTSDKILLFDPIDLRGKYFEAGHSTPVKLKVKGFGDYPYKLHFSVDANNLGEAVNKITLTTLEGPLWQTSGSNVYTYSPDHEINPGEVITFYFDYDQEAMYKSFSGKDIQIAYESDNALVSHTINVGEITGPETKVSLTVPYLFYEDFSSLKVYDGDYRDGPYTSTSNATKAGMDLSQYGLPYGWSGARTGCDAAGTAIAVSGRVDWVSLGATRAYGRLDSPAMTSLKAGANVNIELTFDYSGSKDGASKYSHSAVVGTTDHEGLLSGYATQFNNSESWTGIVSPVKINDIPTNGSAAAANLSMTSIFADCTSETRLTWHVVAMGRGGIFDANNANTWLYVDNVKVKIAK